MTICFFLILNLKSSDLAVDADDDESILRLVGLAAYTTLCISYYGMHSCLYSIQADRYCDDFGMFLFLHEMHVVDCLVILDDLYLAGCTADSFAYFDVVYMIDEHWCAMRSGAVKLYCEPVDSWGKLGNCFGVENG